MQKMKKKYLIGSLCLCALALSSCQDTLDTHPTEIYDATTVWGTTNTAQAFINNTMNSVLTNCGYAGGGSCVDWEAKTPNSMRCSQVGEGIDNFANELGITNASDYGANRFALLRQCNLILENVQNSTTISDGDKAQLLVICSEAWCSLTRRERWVASFPSRRSLTLPTPSLSECP